MRRGGRGCATRGATHRPLRSWTVASTCRRSAHGSRPPPRSGSSPRSATSSGMTVAAECVLAKEAGLAYAAVCMIDNMANGLDDVGLSLDEFQPGVASNRDATGGRCTPRRTTAGERGLNDADHHERDRRRCNRSDCAPVRRSRPWAPTWCRARVTRSSMAAGGALIPGLVNGHTHAAMTLFRSFGDDLPLMTWLETRIWPAEGRLRADDVYWGTRLACLEMIRSGTTKLFDMYWHAPDAARAVEDAGLRGVICSPLIDQGDASGMGALKADAIESLDRVAAIGDRIEPFLGPHSVYTVSPESLAWIGETVADRDIGVHIHLAETRPRSRRLCGRARAASDGADRPLRATRSEVGAGPRLLARTRRARARGRARRNGGHEPGVEHEARRGAAVPVPRGGRGWGLHRTRHRRCCLQQQPRSVPGHEGAGPGAEVRERRPVDTAGPRGVGHRHRPTFGTARWATPSRSVRPPTS